MLFRSYRFRRDRLSKEGWSRPRTVWRQRRPNFRRNLPGRDFRWGSPVNSYYRTDMLLRNCRQRHHSQYQKRSLQDRLSRGERSRPKTACWQRRQNQSRLGQPGRGLRWGSRMRPYNRTDIWPRNCRRRWLRPDPKNFRRDRLSRGGRYRPRTAC